MFAHRSFPHRLVLPALVLLAGMWTAPVLAQDVGAAPPENGCLAIVGHVPLENELFKDRLVLFFDGALTWTPPEAQVQPLVWDPPFAGRCEVAGNRIVFRASRIQEGQTRVLTVSPHPALRSADGRTPCADTRLVLRTFELAAERAWMLDPEEGQRRSAILFNAPVSLEDLAGKIRITDANGAPVAFQVQPGDSEKQVTVLLPEALATPVEVAIPAGVLDRTGLVATVAEKTFRYPVPEILSVERLRWREDPQESPVLVITFSGSVAPEALAQALAVHDAGTGQPLDVTVEAIGARSNDLLVTLAQEPVSGTRVQVRIARELGGTGGQLLPQPHEATLLYRKDEVKVDGGWWHYEGVDGAALYADVEPAPTLDALRAHLETDPPVPNLRVEPGGYGSGFMIYGDWTTGQRYGIVLTPGLEAADGGYTRTSPQVWRTDPVPDVQGMRFAYPGKFYFPRRQGDVLSVESRNVEEAELRVSRMFPTNIAVMLDSLQSGEGSWEFQERWAEQVATHTLSIGETRDRLVRTEVSLRTLLDDSWRGVFHIDSARGSGQIVVWTDIGVLAHWTGTGLVVFAHDLVTLDPLAAASVTVYSSKNQPMGAMATDADGIAVFNSLNPALGTPKVVVVERDGDYTFLELARREDDVEAFNADMPAFGENAYEAFIYGDRDLYRPGATVHLRWLVRTPDGSAAPGVPLQLEIRRPTGSLLRQETVTMSEWGTGGLDVPTERSWQTGRYAVTLKAPGAANPAGMYYFNVEEFVPNRIETQVQLAEDVWTAGKEYGITVRADHLFGAPASGRAAETEVVLFKGEFTPAGWEGFHFGNDAEFEVRRVRLGRQTTGADGAAAFAFTYAPEPKETFPIRAVVRGSVFELGGRAVTGVEDVTLLPDGVLLGTAVAADADPGRVAVQVAAVTADGTPAALAVATATLEREVWHYHVRRYYGYYEPNWTRTFEQVATQEVALQDGRGAAQFSVPGSYGHYRVKVSAPETRQYATRHFDRWWGGQIRASDQAQPGLLRLSPDKTVYEVGDEIQVRLEAPFDGIAFVVIQGEGFKRAMTVKLEENQAVLRFSADDVHVPNVFVHATMVHRLREDSENMYPRSTFAMVNLPVQTARRRVNVAFPDLPEEVRPGQTWRFAVETRDDAAAPLPAEVTVAVVDEGVLALTDYETPDPYGWLMRPRRPEYNRAHYYDKVAYDFGKTPIGGDTLAKRLGKGSPVVDESWVKPLALWSGVVQTDAQGRAEVAFDLPEFNGKVRLVAVACTPSALGVADANVFVRRPYMLRTSMPRFLQAGDAFTCRATLFNTQDAPVQARVAWAGGGLASGEGARTLDLPAKGEASMTADFTTADAIGQGGIRWEAVILDAQGNTLETLTEDAPIPVRAPASYETHFERLVLAPGEERVLENTRFLEGQNQEISVSAGGNPLMRLQQSIEFLARYPYGCVEQVTSRCFPLYMLRQSGPLLESAAGLRTDELDDYLRAGIDQLLSMQTGSGGLGYWPGGNRTYAYGSVYACHFLTLVKKGRQVPVPEQPFKSLQDYVRQVANDWEGGHEDYSGWDEHSRLFVRAYAHFVLALDGDLEAVRQIERFDTIPLPAAARYLLAAALALNTEDHARVQMYLNQAPVFEWGLTEQDATLSSDIRNDAIRLLALTQAEMNPEEQAGLADKLLRFIENHRHGSTQETAFVVTALGAYLQKLAVDPDRIRFMMHTPAGDLAFGGVEEFRTTHTGEGGVYRVVNVGESNLFVNVVTAGTPRDGVRKPVSEGFTVSPHATVAIDGPAAGDNRFRQGRSYVVLVRVKADETGKQVVLDVPLPAGFEIANPRLDAEVLAGINLPDQTIPNHFEVRDDRFIGVFDELPKGNHTICFAVRAVTPGTFQWPAARIECMYQPVINGRGAVETVTVE